MFPSAIREGEQRDGTKWTQPEAVRETLAESLHELRDLAEQSYLLIGLTRDARLKPHLLDLGLELEQRIGLIERRAPPV